MEVELCESCGKRRAHNKKIPIAERCSCSLDTRPQYDAENEKRLRAYTLAIVKGERLTYPPATFEKDW